MESKTQAQKKAERENRRLEQETIRQQEREARLAAIQRSLHDKSTTHESTKVLSKKDQRKQKQALTQQTEFLSDQPVASSDSSTPSAQGSTQPTEVTNDKMTAVPSSYASMSNVLEHNEKCVEREHKMIQEQALQKVRSEEAQQAKEAARIVYNHSTHCPGLRPVLVRLQKALPGCTITPGQLTTVANNAEQFELRFQREESDGGFKFVARSGSTAQDVFITITDKVESPEMMVREAVERAMVDNLDKNKDYRPDDDIPSSVHNRAVAEARNNLWREQQKVRDEEIRQREKEAKEKKKIDVRARTLATKDIDRRQVETHAKRDEEIVSGHARGKKSMK